ncbi:MAG: hypothetical protein GX367_10070 [Bacteroidales bacterium]|nr:hypothetical protein [Bacteroidales bacterium]
MDKKISFSIDEDVYEKFLLATNISKDTEEQAIEMCMRWYIAKTFERASHEYNPKTTLKSASGSDDYYGKAIGRIPTWALKPEQYNHKIIKAYFTAVDIAGTATINMMEQLCSDRNHQELYVPTFKNNYSQMKIDGAKSHGKVFEDDGENVWIWSEVKDTLEKYKLSFYSKEDKYE